MSPNEPHDPDKTRAVPTEPDATQPVRLPGQGGPSAAADRPGTGGAGGDRSEDPTVAIPPGVSPEQVTEQKPKIYIDPAYGQAGQQPPTQAMPAGQRVPPAYGDEPGYPAPDYAQQGYAQQGYPQPYYEQGHYEDQRPEDPVRSIWWPIAVIMASLAIIGAIGGYLWASHDNSSTPAVSTARPTPTGTSAAPTTTQAPTETTTTTEQSPTETTTTTSTPPATTTTTSQSPTTTTTTTTTPAASFPAGVTSCGGNVGAGDHTSCGFAQAVAAAAAGPISQGQTQFQVQAHSDSTNRDYTLDCRRTDLVSCRTDTGATVYILVS